jgi:hypothetical protein
MAQRRHFNQRPARGGGRAPTPVVREVRPAYVKPAPKQYGKPFVLLEDDAKNTFEFIGGAWAPYSMSIAECRAAGEVTQLAQKVNKMTRYQVRLEVDGGGQ